MVGDLHGGREMLTSFCSTPALASTERCISLLEAQFLPQAPLLNHRLQGVAGHCPVL